MIAAALAEDFGAIDLTNATVIPEKAPAAIVLHISELTFVCGLAVAAPVFRSRDCACGFVAGVREGALVGAETTLATVIGAARTLFSVCGATNAAVARARASAPLLTTIEVECDRLDRVAELIEAGSEVPPRDNMRPPMLTEAVARLASRMLLEASGGVTLHTIRPIAETGVDFISITQGAPPVDIGLDATVAAGC